MHVNRVLIAGLALASAIPVASAATVLGTGSVANPSFNDSFASGLTSGNLNWNANTNSSFTTVASGFLFDYAQIQGFSGTDYVAYFNNDSQHPYAPVIITALNGLLSELSFQIGTGYSYIPGVFGYWESYRAGSLAGSGSFNVNTASYINFSDLAGFDEVRVGVLYESFSSFNGPFGNGNALLAANASGKSLVGPVPEPASWAMMLIGFGAVGAGLRYRRRQRVSVNYA